MASETSELLLRGQTDWSPGQPTSTAAPAVRCDRDDYPATPSTVARWCVAVHCPKTGALPPGRPVASAGQSNRTPVTAGPTRITVMSPTRLSPRSGECCRQPFNRRLALVVQRTPAPSAGIVTNAYPRILVQCRKRGSHRFTCRQPRGRLAGGGLRSRLTARCRHAGRPPPAAPFAFTVTAT